MTRRKTDGSAALQIEDEKLILLKNAKNIKIKDFGINKLKQEMSIKEFIRQQDKFIYSDPVQRNEVWDADKKSLLIHSIIMGIPIPNVYVQIANGKYNVIDGKQRLTTIKSFIENKMALSKETPTVSVATDDNEQHEYAIANYVFNALPEEFQDRIQAHTLVFEVLEMNDEIKNIVFNRLNQTEPLKPVEKLKSLMNLSTIEFLSILAQNEFLQAISLSKGLRNRLGDQEVILQSMLFIDKNAETGIGSVEVRKWVESGVSAEVKRNFVMAVDYLKEAIKSIDETKLSKMLKKTHVPMLCLTALHAQSKGVSETEFGKWMESFLHDRYDKGNYKDFAQSSAAKKENASTRYKLMLKDFNKTFNLS